MVLAVFWDLNSFELQKAIKLKYVHKWNNHTNHSANQAYCFLVAAFLTFFLSVLGLAIIFLLTILTSSVRKALMILWKLRKKIINKSFWFFFTFFQ